MDFNEDLHAVATSVNSAKRPMGGRARAGGFTLIEVIIVIVVLGVLSAIATQKYMSLREAASEGVAQGVTAALNGAAVMLHAKDLLKETPFVNATIDNEIASVQTSQATLTKNGANGAKVDVGTATCYLTRSNNTDPSSPAIWTFINCEF